MTSMSFHEHMSGYLTFGQRDYNEGLRVGREQDTRCSYDIDIDIADVDHFLADPEDSAAIRGTFTCGALGGVLAVQGGRFNLFVPTKDDDPERDPTRHMRMKYLLHVVDRDARPLTVAGFKEVVDSQGLDIWTDTTTLLVRVIAGHVEADTGKDVMAAGVMTISHVGLARMMASMRGRGASWWRRVTTVFRFQKHFVGTLAHVYGGRVGGADQPDFPDPQHPSGDPFRGLLPAQRGHKSADDFYDVPGHPGLRRRIFGFHADDGRPLTLHNIRNETERAGEPVICLHGTSVRGDIFVGAPGGASFARALVDAGYDVWIPNWRASIDMEPRPYTLDEAAIFDHPAAIAEVRSITGAPTVKAVVHCQGSTSFMITALLGKANDVTHVVSNAVSLHPIVPKLTLRKGQLVLPLIGLRMKYVSTQWAIRSPTVLAKGFARISALVRRECNNPVCQLSNFLYGTGPDVLWVHDKLGDSAHEFISREFGFVSYNFLKQINRSCAAEHLVAAPGENGEPKLADDLIDRTLPEGQRWTFVVGVKNKAFLPEGQVRSHAHFEKQCGRKDFHRLILLDDYGHLDPFLGKDAPAEVYPKLIKALNGWSD